MPGIIPRQTWKRRNIDPPAASRIDFDDGLYVRGFSYGTASGTIEIKIRYIDDDGAIKVQLTTVTKGQLALGATPVVFGIGTGYLLGIYVQRLLSTQTSSTETWVEVGIARGLSGTPFMAQPLCSGYVTNQHGPSWPWPGMRRPEDGPSSIRLIKGTDPAAGIEIIEAMPRHLRWRLLSFSFQLAAAAGGGEVVRLSLIVGGVDTYYRSGPAFAQAAGTTIRYCFGDPGFASQAGGTTPAGGDTVLCPWPPHLWFGTKTIGNDVTLETTTDNLAAGDNFTAPLYIVEELQDHQMF